MRVLCKKDYDRMVNYFKANTWYDGIIDKNNTILIETKEKFYNNLNLESYTSRVWFQLYPKPCDFAGNLSLFEDYFYTEKELRKLKLEQLG